MRGTQIKFGNIFKFGQSSIISISAAEWVIIKLPTYRLWSGCQSYHSTVGHAPPTELSSDVWQHQEAVCICFALQLEINLLPAHKSAEEVQVIIVSLMNFLEQSFNRIIITAAVIKNQKITTTTTKLTGIKEEFVQWASTKRPSNLKMITRTQNELVQKVRVSRTLLLSVRL